MTDPADWRAELSALVENLGPIPPAIRSALLAVPRHRFAPAESRAFAYVDEPLALPGADATISAPHMVACQLEEAELAPGLNVLEVGSGSGYLLALIAELVRPGGRVLGIEVEPGLVTGAERILGDLGYDDVVEVRCGDGASGAPDRAPFDRIVVSCATHELTPDWKTQLAADGTLLAPVGNAFGQTLIRWRRRGGRESLEGGPEVRFVPLRRARAPRPSHI